MAQMNLLLCPFARLDTETGIVYLTFYQQAPDDDSDPAAFQSQFTVQVEAPNAVVEDVSG